MEIIRVRLGVLNLYLTTFSIDIDRSKLNHSVIHSLYLRKPRLKTSPLQGAREVVFVIFTLFLLRELSQVSIACVIVCCYHVCSFQWRR